MFSAQKIFSIPTMLVDEQVFWQLVSNSESKALIDAFRQSGDAALKRKLPAFIFQAMFDETASKKGKMGAWRKQAATRLTGLVVMDIDHVDNPREVFQNIEVKMKNENLGILLVYITPSGKGLKIVFKARKEWGNLIDNQHAMAALLGLEVDESCKDASRMSFVCREEDILFIDKELFIYEDKDYAQQFNDQYRNGHSAATRNFTTTHGAAAQSAGTLKPLAAEQVAQSVGMHPTDGPAFKGIPYAFIVHEWWKQQGGVPVEGERNVKLYQLAVNLRAICDNNRGLLLQIMPRLGLEEMEFQSIVDSACKEPPKGISKALRELLDALGKWVDANGRWAMPDEVAQQVLQGVPSAALGGDAGAVQQLADAKGNGQAHHQAEKESRLDDEINRKLWCWGEQIEALFEPFPVLKDVCRGLRKNQYPAALFVAGGLLMTLMTRCSYRFYDDFSKLVRLNCSALFIGDPASGKRFATRLYQLLMSPLFEADKVGRNAINAYRELVKTKGANKEKPKKPKVVVRIHPARTSNAQFIQDMVNATETVDGQEMQLHMFTFDTELDNTIALQKGGAWIDKMNMELKAFHNEEEGQAYSNIDSVIENFVVTWNYIYTGTPLALKNKVKASNFGSGLATRLTCIPVPSNNFQMIERHRVDNTDSDNRLKDWAFKLDRTKGELSVGLIVDELYNWTARRMADAEYNNSKADDMLCRRCAFHGVNFSAPFIVMRHWNELHQDGDFWCGEFQTDEVDWRLAELIVNMQYACQRHYFGAMAEMYYDDKLKDAAMKRQRLQRTVENYQRLPNEFTIDDVLRCFSLDHEPSGRKCISRLLQDHLIRKIGTCEVNGRNLAKFEKVNNLLF